MKVWKFVKNQFNLISIGMLLSCKYLVKSNPRIVNPSRFLLANTPDGGIEWNFSNKSFSTDFKQIGSGNETSLAAAAAATFDWSLGLSSALHSTVTTFLCRIFIACSVQYVKYIRYNTIRTIRFGLPVVHNTKLMLIVINCTCIFSLAKLFTENNIYYDIMNLLI